MILKRLLIVFVFFFTILSLNAQSKFLDYEQDLNAQFERLKIATDDSVKLSLSQKIMNDLKTVLRKKGSFSYPFSLINNLGKVTSPDEELRIFSWNYTLENGDYRYFALCQKKDGRKTRLFEFQQNPQVEESMTAKFSSGQWLGALYYQIVPFKYNKRNLYLLLGWDGNNDRTSKKVIEILGFSKTGEPEFGFPLINWRGKRLSRVIFEYSKQAQMQLRYHERGNCVVFDHLSPSEPRYINQFEYYGPDFSYDALEFKNGIWNLVEEFDTRNLN